MRATLNDQVELLSHWGIADDPARFNASSQIIQIDKLVGTGCFERYEFNNLTLSRVNCQFHQTHNLKNDSCQIDYTLYVVLQGSYDFQITASASIDIDDPCPSEQQSVRQALAQQHKSDQAGKIKLTAPSIWLFKGDLGELTATIRANESIKAFYIELSNEVITRLTEQTLTVSHDAQAACEHEPLLLSQLLNLNHYWHIAMDPTPQAGALFEQAWQLFNSPSPENEMMFMALQGQTLSFTSQLLMQRSDSLIAAACETPPIYALQAKLLLDQFYHQNWNIHRLAQKVGTNECYLKRSFKQLTGQTLGQYRTQKRMQAAKELLHQGQTVAKVAEQTGFNSNDYFVKVFAKYFGYSPSKLAK